MAQARLDKAPWTKAMIDEVVELRSIVPKLTYKEIGEKVGRSASSVKTKLCDLGVKAPINPVYTGRNKKARSSVARYRAMPVGKGLEIINAKNPTDG